ncbi:MAG: hypothetical protein CM1200mP9_05130 [Gammaproteobacteria bacterium]|nr:MAG: hypothetical protein CM1200mP9_05130 [Gammaproteobacteria bacterium]
MESLAVDLLGKNDSVVCIGGNTPDESYLNAMSVIAVAENEQLMLCIRGLDFCQRVANLLSWSDRGESTSSDRRSPAWKRWGKVQRN